MRAAAWAVARTALSRTERLKPANVITLRLWSGSLVRWSTAVPGTDRIASSILSMTERSRPSEKFGTHSMSRLFSGWSPTGSINYHIAGAKNHGDMVDSKLLGDFAVI